MRLMYFDLETSGLEYEYHGILSVGAIDSKSDTYERRCSLGPLEACDLRALEVNGISVNDVRRPGLSLALPVLLDFLNFAKGSILVGWNPTFDMGFIRKYISKSYLEGFVGHRFIDVHSIMYAKYGKSMGMSEAAKTLGVPEEPKPHTALNGAIQVNLIHNLLMRS